MPSSQNIIPSHVGNVWLTNGSYGNAGDGDTTLVANGDGTANVWEYLGVYFFDSAPIDYNSTFLPTLKLRVATGGTCFAGLNGSVTWHIGVVNDPSPSFSISDDYDAFATLDTIDLDPISSPQSTSLGQQYQIDITDAVEQVIISGGPMTSLMLLVRVAYNEGASLTLAGLTNSVSARRPYLFEEHVFSETMTGGATLAGKDGFIWQNPEKGRGGAVAGGTATVSKGFIKIGTGGAVIAPKGNIWQNPEKGRGGAVVGGTASVFKSFPITPTGGALCGGSPNIWQDPENGRGGAVVGSAALTDFSFNLLVTGGAVTGGTAPGYEYSHVASGGALCGGIAPAGKQFVNTPSGGVVIAGVARVNATSDPTFAFRDGYGGVTGGVGGFVENTIELRVATNAGNADYSIIEIEFQTNIEPQTTITSAIVRLTYISAPVGSQPLQVTGAIMGQVFTEWAGDWTTLESNYNNFVTGGFGIAPVVLSGSSTSGSVANFDITAPLQLISDAAGDPINSVIFYLKATDDPNGFGADHNFAAIEHTVQSEAQLVLVLNGGTGPTTWGETMSGGVVGGGSPRISHVGSKSTSGGATCNGVATVIFPYTMLGGIAAGSAASVQQVSTFTSSNGAFVAGDVAPTVYYNITSTSGVLAGGHSDELVGGSEQSTGGITAGGSATVTCVYETIIVGGSVGGSTGIIFAYYSPTSTGGAVSGGAALLGADSGFTASGGAKASGTASISLVATVAGANGISGGGLATSTVTYNPRATGGIAASGQCDVTSTVEPTAGGAILSGLAIEAVTRDLTTVAGILINGRETISVICVDFIATGGVTAAPVEGTQPSYYPVISGGAQIGGTLQTEFTDNEVGSSNGVKAGGVAHQTRTVNLIATGGIEGGGTASEFQKFVVKGGATLGGSATESVLYRFTITGGVKASSTAIINVLVGEALQDGCLASGAAIVLISKIPTISGGVQTGGSAREQRSLEPEFIIGGARPGGAADIVFENGPIPQGGLVCSGTLVQTSIHNQETANGVKVSGHGSLIFDMTTSGGAIVNGGFFTRIYNTESIVALRAGSASILDYIEFFTLVSTCAKKVKCGYINDHQFCAGFEEIQSYGSRYTKQKRVNAAAKCLGGQICYGSSAKVAPITLCRQKLRLTRDSQIPKKILR